MRRVASRVVYEGPIATVRVDTFRHDDGTEAERQVVAHPGAVAILAHDAEHLFLVRQPREPVGEESLLELPAGKLDVEGESALDCAKRELAEEVAREAAHWSELKRFYTSPGFAEEEVTVFLARDLSAADVDPDPSERIDVVRWPLGDLDGAIAACRDAKSLIGLLLFARMHEG